MTLEVDKEDEGSAVPVGKSAKESEGAKRPSTNWGRQEEKKFVRMQEAQKQRKDYGKKEA